MGEELHKDPAIEHWARMRETTHLYWRPTKGNVAKGAIALVAFPVALYYGILYGFVIELLLIVL